MRLRRVKDALETVESSKYIVLNPEQYKGKFNTLFSNDNPIHVEIGMGKGDFVVGMAEKYPNINFIGIEKYESVMVRGVQKLEDTDYKNLKLLHMDALNICDVFDHEIDTIYLNFSDPWPKNKHAKRRLTSEVFLKLYDNIFKGEPHIVQKTDNILLFASSIESLSKYGYTIERCSLDLENEDIPNVETEYERKFKAKGFKINYLDAVKYSKK